MSINKEQASQELKTIKERIEVLEGIINAPDKPTAEQWIIDFIKQDFTVKLTDGYITYYLGNQWIFQQDLKSNRFWCYYYKVWVNFVVEYNMNYEQIQGLYKSTVLKAFNCEGFTPSPPVFSCRSWC